MLNIFNIIVEDEMICICIVIRRSYDRKRDSYYMSYLKNLH